MQFFEPHHVHACKWLKGCSFHTMRISPVTNEPVYPWNVLKQVFSYIYKNQRRWWGKTKYVVFVPYSIEYIVALLCLGFTQRHNCQTSEVRQNDQACYTNQTSDKYFLWTLNCTNHISLCSVFFPPYCPPLNFTHHISTACIIFASQNLKLALNHGPRVKFHTAWKEDIIS